MRRPERRIDDAAAVADQADRQIVQAEIDRDLLVAAARDEGRDGVDVGDEAFHGHAGGHADDVRLGDAFHELAVGHTPRFISASRPGLRSEPMKTHARIALGELVDHVEAGLAHGSYQRLVHVGDDVWR